MGSQGLKEKFDNIFFVEKIKLHFNCWTCTENLFHMWVWFEPVPPLQQFLAPTCAKIFHPQRTSSKVKLRHFVVWAALNCVSTELQYFVQGVDFLVVIRLRVKILRCFLTENTPETDQDEINVRRRKFTSKAAHHVTTTCPPDQMFWVIILARLSSWLWWWLPYLSIHWQWKCQGRQGLCGSWMQWWSESRGQNPENGLDWKKNYSTIQNIFWEVSGKFVQAKN